jgi:uncharacterized membrane protein YcaP (DUF421 family)
MYLILFLLLRVIIRRRMAPLGMTDLLVIVLLADAAQNAMAGEYRTITEGVLLCTTIMLWAHLLDRIAFAVPALRRYIEPPPLLLVHRGRLQRRNMRAEMVTEEELSGQLREQGIERIEEVKAAFLEGDGHLSVIRTLSSGGSDRKGQENQPDWKRPVP